MSLTDLITLSTEEAWNQYLEDQRASQGELALYAHKLKQKKSKGHKEGKWQEMWELWEGWAH